jgi:hypothetical protein
MTNKNVQVIFELAEDLDDGEIENICKQVSNGIREAAHRNRHKHFIVDPRTDGRLGHLRIVQTRAARPK